MLFLAFIPVTNFAYFTLAYKFVMVACPVTNFAYFTLAYKFVMGLLALLLDEC
jgi:hypothetical protein